jgi:hypothetical protein
VQDALMTEKAPCEKDSRVGTARPRLSFSRERQFRVTTRKRPTNTEQFQYGKIAFTTQIQGQRNM